MKGILIFSIVMLFIVSIVCAWRLSDLVSERDILHQQISTLERRVLELSPWEIKGLKVWTQNKGVQIRIDNGKIEVPTNATLYVEWLYLGEPAIEVKNGQVIEIPPGQILSFTDSTAKTVTEPVPEP